MPSASFNPAHQKHTDQTDNGTGKRTGSIGNKVSRFEIAPEIRLTEFNDVSAEKREGTCTEHRHQIRNNDPVMHRIVKTHEEKESQCHISQKVSPFVLPNYVLGNKDILGKRQVDDCDQTDEAEYETDDSYCP